MSPDNNQQVNVSAPGGSQLRLAIGWFAVIVSTGFTSFWAFWGIIENFHEG